MQVEVDDELDWFHEMELPWPGIDEVGDQMLLLPSNASSIASVADSVSRVAFSYSVVDMPLRSNSLAQYRNCVLCCAAVRSRSDHQPPSPRRRDLPTRRW